MQSSMFSAYLGEEKANLLESAIMARRPEMRREEILTEENLKELRRHLALQSPVRVEDFYNAAHRACLLREGDFPSAGAMQRLVTAWKQLRKWRGRPRG